MISETFLDFCFIRKASGNFGNDIEQILQSLFKGTKLHWYLDEKEIEEAEVVVAEVKGMSRWQSESEVIQFLEEHASEHFWEFLQGYQMYVYPVQKGCNSCD
ncbi:hypothetical protein J27TS8_10420 [Robertmurraya siralis]|uniref:Uncharacterized protein n=1 Tax=Robertmurraya siralis TaxID=77777 RepID=A0A919WG04_9BACI|nr:hypothetical protein [Robertmurraya siralis]PAE22545.1 hypothetical protein CHH80_00870 [Bacillus sp. 7504-2]GIN61049.1 hypothetical protein J27TS8_10420 [Robertmurraya siralis]